MVTIMPSNPWRCADFLERVHPGIALSGALHAGLFFLLAYLLAFHHGLQVQAPTEDPPFVLVDPPKPPPQLVQVQSTTNIKTLTTRVIDRIQPQQRVAPFASNDQAAVGTPKAPPVAGPPAPPVIINPK